MARVSGIWHVIQQLHVQLLSSFGASIPQKNCMIPELGTMWCLWSERWDNLSLNMCCTPMLLYGNTQETRVYLLDKIQVMLLFFQLEIGNKVLLRTNLGVFHPQSEISSDLKEWETLKTARNFIDSGHQYSNKNFGDVITSCNVKVLVVDLEILSQT